MNSFFSVYALVGLLVFMGLLLVSLISGLILSRLFNRKWIILLVVLVMSLVFYFGEIVVSIWINLLLLLVSFVLWIVARKTKNSESK